MPAFGSPIPYAEPLWYSRDITPYYKDSHRHLRKEVRRYFDEEIIPNAYEWEEAGKVPDEVRMTSFLILSTRELEQVIYVIWYLQYEIGVQETCLTGLPSRCDGPAECIFTGWYICERLGLLAYIDID